MFQFTVPGARAVAAATLLGAIVLARPLPAISEDFAPAPGADLVEARIKELHSKFHVTAAEEAQWSNVAQMMRDNAKTMVGLQKDRGENAKSTAMSAVDVLKSYSEVIDAHADGIHKFIPVFQAFYDTMSDEQKKTADALFRSRARTAAHKSLSKE
jgi:LTXXQ motif family protein